MASLEYVLRVQLPEPATWLVCVVIVAAGSVGALLASRMQQATRKEPQAS